MSDTNQGTANVPRDSQWPLWEVFVQPPGNLLDPGDLRARVVLVLLIRLQLRKPPRHLAFQEAFGFAEIG